MSAYLSRRAASSIVILIGISLLTFGMLHLVGGPPGRAVLGLKASPASVASWNRTHGYDEPFLEQYWNYMLQVLQGNLGYSYKQNQTVNAALAERAPISAYLSGLALVFSIVIALPVGLVGAAEAKDALRASGLPALTNVSEKGGAAVAAAAFSALADIAGAAAGDGAAGQASP